MADGPLWNGSFHSVTQRSIDLASPSQQGQISGARTMSYSSWYPRVWIQEQCLAYSRPMTLKK